MSDEEIEIRFYEVINSFPPRLRKRATRWLEERIAAHDVVQRLSTPGGVAALLLGND